MILKSVYVPFYSHSPIVDIEVESEDSTSGLAHFESGGTHPVILKSIMGHKPSWQFVVRCAPGTIVGRTWDSRVQQWDDGEGWNAPPESYHPIASQLSNSMRDRRTVACFKQEDESDTEYYQREYLRMQSIAQEWTEKYPGAFTCSAQEMERAMSVYWQWYKSR